jgi:hypothetical protein
MKKKANKKKGRNPHDLQERLDPSAWQGQPGFLRGSRATEPADRRSGRIRGREPHGQGSRQAARDPKDGGRPRGRRRG